MVSGPMGGMSTNLATNMTMRPTGSPPISGPITGSPSTGASPSPSPSPGPTKFGGARALTQTGGLTHGSPGFGSSPITTNIGMPPALGLPGAGGIPSGNAPVGGYSSAVPPPGASLGGGSTIASRDPGSAAAQPGNTSNKNLQTVLANLYNQNLGTRGELLGQQLNMLNFNDLMNSPLYKSNLAASNSQTSTAYDQAVANARARANSSGFGYISPMEQGAEAGLRGQEAGALAANPRTALLQTVQPELQAAGMLGNDMNQFNPDALLSTWANLVNQKSQSSSGLMGGLMSALSSMGGQVIQQNPGGVFD